MKVHNYLKEVKILKTPTSIKLDDFLNKYCTEASDNLTLYNISHEEHFIDAKEHSYSDIQSNKKEDGSYEYFHVKEDGQKVILGNFQDYKNLGNTYRYRVNQSKFNHNYGIWFRNILKKVGLPYHRIIAYASLKKLEPASHHVHCDSDNNYGKGHDVICRYLIPLSDGPPTCYFDQCMEDNQFYTRFGKNDCSVVGENNKPINLNVTHLYDLKTNDRIEIDDNVTDYENISHIGYNSLKGLNVHVVGEWSPGTIHLFPCNVLHSSTDIDMGNNEKIKWMLNGVLYDSRIKK